MKCNHVGCKDTNTKEFFYPDNNSRIPDYYYCVTHAFNNGFCWLCGGFYGGVESFDFPLYGQSFEGLCEECSKQVIRDNDLDISDDQEYLEDDDHVWAMP